MKHFGDDLISFLQKSAAKIEEMQVQAKLGQAELKDSYAEFKNDLTNKIHQIERGETKVQKNIQEKLNPIQQKMDELELQFALGKADANDLIQKELKILKKNLHELSKSIKKKFSKKIVSQ